MANECDKQRFCQRPRHAETMKMLSNLSVVLIEPPFCIFFVFALDLSEIVGTIFVKDSDTIDVYGEVIKDFPGQRTATWQSHPQN